MIISEKKVDLNTSREKWLILGGVILLLGFIIWLLAFANRKPILEVEVNQIVCDAENIQGDEFVKEDYTFLRGNTQSNDYSRSGNYSSKIELGDKVQYGFGYQLKNFNPGEVFRVSVWRLKNPQNEGRLVIQNSGGKDFYRMEEVPVEVEDSGWEKLSLIFAIPFGERSDFYNVYVYASGHTEVYFDDLIIEKIGNWPDYAERVKKLNIRVSPEGLKKLERKRDEALRKGLLKTSDNDWVKAILADSTGQEMPAEVRLKGDWTDHLKGDKWSFRIKVKSPHAWQPVNQDDNGLITFSVHTPESRYFLNEWLVHQCWMEEGVLTPRYEFTEVTLNGKSLGIYAIEEHFEKQLVENQQRREGPILKFSEEGMWSGIERQLQNHGYVHHDYRASIDDWENAWSEAFGQQRTLSDSVLKKQYKAARQLMFDFKNGLKPAIEVFDIDKLARFYAIADVFNAYHGIVWHNQRFYFNPVLGKLEPIGFDAFGGKPPRRYTILGEGALNPENIESNRLFGYLLQDKEFNKLYFKHLYTYSSRKFLTKFLEKHQIGWDERLRLLQMEFTGYQPDYKDFLQDGLFVHSLLLPYEDLSIRAFTQHRNNGSKKLSVQNQHHLPVEIIGSGYSRNQIDRALDTTITLPAHVNRRYLSRLFRDSLIKDFNSTKFLHAQALSLQKNAEQYQLEVNSNARFIHYKLPGVDSIFSARIMDWSGPELPNIQPSTITSDINDSKYETLFLVRDQKIMFYPGQHLFTEPLVLPAGYEVSFSEGTEIDLTNGAYLLSNSPVQAYGVEDNPVLFTSSDGTGQGVAVLQTGTPSVFYYSIFEGLGTLESRSQHMTGAFTGYEADIRFYNCVFRNNHCEDALNLIRSNFLLQSCVFSDISSDAFDSDFCKGEVRNCSFRNSINDAMDFSGSVVNIFECHIEAPGDKGISCGEESDVSVFDTTIENSPIAVASKDLSVLFMRNITINNCRQGFVAFQKKPEFGPGKIIVESYTSENVDKLFNIGEGSFLQLPEE